MQAGTPALCYMPAPTLPRGKLLLPECYLRYPTSKRGALPRPRNRLCAS